MEAEIKCAICGEILGKLFNYQIRTARLEHIKNKHPNAYDEYMDAERKYIDIRNRYCLFDY